MKNLIGKYLLLVILAVFTLYSCEKLLMDKDSETDNITVFEDLWKFTGENYSFFSHKNIHWNEVYSRYRPRINNELGEVEFFDICSEMLYELRDGHVNLLSSFDRSRNWEWYLDRPENFYYAIIERYYFKNNERYVGPFQFLDMGDIIYVYYGSFSNYISQGTMDFIIDQLTGKKGLIIDVRNNGGGSLDNAKIIAERFTDIQKQAGVNYIKNSPKPNDFIKERIYIKPYDGKRFSGKVVVLTNRKSYSATTYFTQYMSVLDNVTLVGDTTGGGGGLPAFHDLPNGWLLRVSSTMFLSPYGLNIEAGVPPDIQLDIDEQVAFSEKIDPIIEKAIEIIRE